MKQLTKEGAKLIAEHKVWKKLNSLELAYTQLNQERLFCDFNAFHEALEKETSESIFTHQFADKAFIAHCKDVLKDRLIFSTSLSRMVRSLEYAGFTDVLWYDKENKNEKN